MTTPSPTSHDEAAGDVPARPAEPAGTAAGSVPDAAAGSAAAGPAATTGSAAAGAAREEPTVGAAAAEHSPVDGSAPAEQSPVDGSAPAGPPRRPGSARRMFAMTVLVSEVLVVLFATLVAHGLDLADRSAVWGVGGAAMVACAVTAGLLRHRVGYVIGSVVQVLLVVAGLVLPTMFVVGGIFAVLWAASLTVGARIDVEREERYRAEVEYYETHR
ncbi:DUF4233 domain-containing protein [Georgenia subflava]|uniref:DUF4233 domain-containing protein n=1 Tax=Georgenia subflava TaxID=1622177 RepID=A0A6N7EV76_9MICO|nr:DUF4233 domain-containing protein [Georgenia subflava]MPV39034.1 DUF4233 domain-containing protein [Georgenia subflava]